MLSISLRKERKIMIDKQQDFLTLTGAAPRARSEGYDITYHSLRNLVAAGYISHVPNGSRIYIFYPNLVNFIQNGLTAEQSLEYQLSRARNWSNRSPSVSSDAEGIFLKQEVQIYVLWKLRSSNLRYR